MRIGEDGRKERKEGCLWSLKKQRMKCKRNGWKGRRLQGNMDDGRKDVWYLKKGRKTMEGKKQGWMKARK